ncbi:MAG: hypothetical protein NTV87_07385 [Ignavibacteriae bacterium]|nr:hypothetical protein [Ignavibacteriota bacterium]
MKYKAMQSGLFRISALLIVFLIAILFNAGTAINQPKDSLRKDSLRKDSLRKDSLRKDSLRDTTKINPVQIDTSKILNQIDTSRTLIKVDSITTAVKENTLTNTKLFIYIFITLGGLGLFYFIFVQTLFKTFHKARSTRQSLMLSWDLFFIVSIVWVFIVWGIAAGMWSSGAFMTVLIFLFIISLILSLIAVKSK